MVQHSEIVNLFLGVVSALVLMYMVRYKEAPRMGWMYGGYSLIVLSYMATVLEGIVWGTFFNLLEHFGYAAAGVMFYVGVLELTGGTSRDPSP